MNSFSLGTSLTRESMYSLLDPNLVVQISPETVEVVTKCRVMLEEEIEKEKPIYGVSTGFGQLANTWIEKERLEELQINLIRSHAAGMGDPIPKEITRTAMILLANSLAKGHSGIRMQTLELLKELINFNAIPITYQLGSLGASGDLAPLAHVALVLMGEGVLEYHGQRMDANEFFKRTGLEPVRLAAKEGLALINGTHFITAYALHILNLARQLLTEGMVAAALSLEALRGTSSHFNPLISSVRPHHGQQTVSSLMLQLLEGSQILKSHADPEIDHKVQDPYSLRCIPQVLGAAWDAFEYLEAKVVIEVNSVTDNPLIFPEEGMVLSGGNFHAEPLALPLEMATLAFAEIGSIAERRINRLVHPATKELPPFLAPNAGLQSGYMIPHYTAAATLNRLRTLCFPAVIDNSPVSGDQEDHVSMGMTSAIKCHEAAKLCQQIISLELLLAIRGLNLQEGRPQSSTLLEKIIDQFNHKIPFIRDDHYVHPIMKAAYEYLKSNPFRDLSPSAFGSID
ncbi:MAG: histidine ammonia-lyase [Methanobacteriota archaeon]|nr:MAG: histidine ammonia-lyase [Euryarchaeota archaeon]